MKVNINGRSDRRDTYKDYNKMKTIIKLNKLNDSVEGSVVVDGFLPNMNAFVSTEFSSNVASSTEIPFIIEAIGYAPALDDVEIFSAITKKVDMTAPGPNSNKLMNLGADQGLSPNIQSKPLISRDLPPGFEELYK